MTAPTVGRSSRFMGAVVMMATEVGSMTPQEAGAFFKQLRQARQLRLSDVVDATTVPNVPYLSSLEKGRYNVLNSEHFPSLARFFGLSGEQIRQMKPDAFIEVRQEKTDLMTEDTIAQNRIKVGNLTRVRIKLFESGIRSNVDLHNEIFISVSEELIGQELGGLSLGGYVEGIPVGFFALWSARKAKAGDMVVVEKNGAYYPAFLLQDGRVKMDKPIDNDTPLTFMPDEVIGVVEDIRMLGVPKRSLS